MLASLAHGQDWQFVFDANGNLLVQTAEISALPQILGQPQPQVVGPGELASFFVVVADSRALTYQWRFNGTNLTGANNDALLLHNVGATNEGQYSVVVANPSGSVTSAPASLMLDGDGDGMPDSWELANFGSVTSNPTGDFDGDGVSNLDEFLDGTNPTNSASAHFRLTVMSDGGQVTVIPSRFSFTNGETVTLTATAFAPDHFHGWTGDTNTTSNPLTLTMTTNKTVFAHFGSDDIAWTNLAGGDWNVASNWKPNFVPGANDNVFITSNVTVTVNSAAECSSLTLGGLGSSPTLSGTGTLTLHRTSFWMGGTMGGGVQTVIEAGATLNLSGGTHTSSGGSSITGAGQLTVSGGTATLAGLVNVSTLTISGGTADFDGTGAVTPAVVNLSGGTLGGSNVVTVGSAMNWTGGTMSGSGRTIIPAGVTLNVANASAVTLGRTLENGGTVLWTDGTISLISAVITNRAGALFETRGAGSLNFQGGNTSRFDNAGTFRKSVSTGTTTVSGNVTFNNYGTVEIQTGTLTLAFGGANSGTYDVSAGTTLNLAGGTHTSSGGSSITGAGHLTVSGGTATTLAGLVNVSGTNLFSGGGIANLTGNYICTNNTVIISGGTANFDGTGAVTPAVVNLSSGTLGGSQVVTVGSAMNWTGGTMSGSGRTIIPAGVTLNVANASAVTLGRTLENGGTVLWTDGTISLISAVITNRAGALFETRGAGSLNFQGGNTSRFDNAGTFRKSVSTGTTTVSGNVTFNNYGTVEIRSGILAANGGYTSTANALLQSTIGGTTVGTGYGQLQVAGTVTMNGGLSVDLLPGYSPATNDTFTVLTAGTRSGTFGSFSYPSNRVTLLLSNSPTSVILRATDVFPVPQPVLLTPQLAGSNALLTWTATSNVTYRLENNADVSSTNWTSLPGDVTTLSNTASKLDALTPSNRFYRVRALP